ncbi:hypothetical protein HZS_2215 [Henneguya salminicola]|nr:hypothetical protein HZS_2215 [Henneguya salminicola]
MKSFLSSLLILNFCLDFYCELFTSSLKLCHLLHSELNQLRILEDTLGNDKKSANITMLLKDIREYVPISYFNKKEYDIDDCLFEESKMTRFITNPVNAYMIIQRFSKEWTDVQREISFSKERSKIILNKSFNLSGQGEIRGVREAFYRLGVFYHLEPNFLANGQLAPEWSHLTKDWTIVPKKMASNDLFEIGKIAFKHKDYDSTLGWMEQALKSLTSEQTPNYKELMFDILDYLSWSEYSVGLNQEAYLHCLRMIEIRMTQITNEFKTIL